MTTTTVPVKEVHRESLTPDNTLEGKPYRIDGGTEPKSSQSPRIPFLSNDTVS